jgi:hypothetical protein
MKNDRQTSLKTTSTSKSWSKKINGGLNPLTDNGGEKLRNVKQFSSFLVVVNNNFLLFNHYPFTFLFD